MDRRALLKIAAAAAVTGCARSNPAAEPLRVVVAGAGIVGASIAYHLARAGAAVTVIDKQGPATHASRGTFAWINATWAKQPRFYHELSQASVSYWKDLQQTLNLPVRWGGSLEWFASAERQEKLVAQITEQIAWGEPARMVSAAELAELEPQVKFEPGAIAAYSPNDGAVDPVLATQLLLAAAEQHGAVVRFPVAVNNVSRPGDEALRVETSAGSIEADRLVLATGAAPDLAAQIAGLDIPQRSTPGVIAITKPMPRLVNRVVAAPGVHMHQRDDGRIVLGEQDGAPKNQAHALRLDGRPNDFPTTEIGREHAGRMLNVAKRFVPGIANAEFDAVYIGWRPLPLDGHPVLGVSPANPDVYLAIMHSGVTLAPIVGKFVTRELTEQVSVPLLEKFRPTRSFESIKRY